jgi:hypothetical protein
MSSPEEIQDLIVRAIKLYAAGCEDGERFPPIADPAQLTATEVALFCSQLLKAADIAPFELAMWETWSV